MAEDLYDLLAGDVFLDIAVDRAERRLLAEIVFAAVLHQLSTAERKHRQERDRNQRKPDVRKDHHGERADQRECAGDHRGDRRIQHRSDVVDVVGEARHDFAVGFIVEKANRQRLQLCEQILANARDRVLGNADHQAVLQIRAAHAREVNAAHNADHRREIGDALGSGNAGFRNAVDDRAQQIRACDRRGGAHQHAGEHGDQPLFEHANIGQNPANGRADVLGLASGHAARSARAWAGLFLWIGAMAAVARGQVFKRSCGH